MIAVPAGVRVLVWSSPVDFRKGIDGLSAYVQLTLEADPFLCVGRRYVAAPSRCELFRGVGEFCRHIIFICFPATAAPNPWAGIASAACRTRRPCPIHGASSRRLQRRSDVWWQPANVQTTPGWSEGLPRTATAPLRANGEGRGAIWFCEPTLAYLRLLQRRPAARCASPRSG